MNTKHMIIAVLGVALALWSTTVLACEAHWEPMPDPVMDECDTDSDCGQGSCQLTWVDWDNIPCDENDYDCFEIAKCVDKAPQVASSTTTCFHDAECDGTQVCALPLCADHACPETPGVCMSTDPTSAMPESAEVVLAGCQGDQSPSNAIVLALLLVGMLMRRRWMHRSRC